MQENVVANALEQVNWAKEDLKLKDRRRGLSNCWNNLKNALNTQVDHILIENDLKKEAMTWDIPNKLEKLKDLGYTTPESFRKLIKNRNYLIHRNVIPKDDPEPYTDLVTAFINETNGKLANEKRKEILNNEQLLDEFVVLLKKEKRSPATISSYLREIKEFLKFIDKKPNDVRSHDLDKFISHLSYIKREGRYSICRSALIFFFNKLLHKNLIISVKVPRPYRKFDTVTKEQIKELFSVIKNKRDWLMIGLLYGSGLKTGNVVVMKRSDIDFYKKINKIKRTGKRPIEYPTQSFIMPDVLRKDLQEYCKDKPNYIFLDGKEPSAVERALQKKINFYSSKIGVYFNSRILRNSFEKHLAEDGVGVVQIYSLLGKSQFVSMQGFKPATDEELSKVTSPLDRIL